MTEMANGMSQSQDTSNSQPVNPVSAPSSESYSAPNVPQERTFKQSEVNDIVRRAKHEASESFKRMQSEQPQYLQQKLGDNNYQPQPTPNANNGTFDESNVRRMAAEEAQRLRDEWIQSSQMEAQKQDAQRTVQEFWNKVSTGKEKYSDFEQITGDIEYSRFPNVVHLLAKYTDNSDGVLYELGKDRIKMANLEQLANLSPRDAIVQAQRLSQSIKDNELASKTRVPNEPLSQMRPSNTGTDNGAMSVSDYRRKYKV